MFLRDTPQPDGTPTWVALEAPDIAAAQAFYESLFGWEIDESPDHGAEFIVARKDARAVAGFARRKRSAADSACWTTYLATHDIDSALPRVLTHGGAILTPPQPRAEADGQARTAVIQDSGGARCGLWQARQLAGMGIWEAQGAIMWSEQFSADPGDARMFYKSVFGNVRFAEPFSWHFGDPANAIPGYAMYSTNGQDVGAYGANAVASVGALDPMDPVKGPHWTACFAILDINQAVETLIALGGRVLRGPYGTMFGPLAMVADNQGAAFMLAVKPQRATERNS